MKLKSLLSAALLLPTAAFAVSTPGAYIQGAIGETAVFSNDDFSFNGNDTVDTISGQIAGGYLWGCDNLNYGLEVGVLYYPSAKKDYSYAGVKYASVKVDGTNVDLLGVLKYNFDNGFNVFAKAGAAYVDQKVTLTNNILGLSGSQTDNKIAPEVALGVGYQFDQNWGVNLTVNTVFAGKFGDSNKVVSRNGSALLGVSYRFV